MTDTYDPQLDTDLDYVRARIGDTDVTAPHLADATLTALLAQYERPLQAAAAAARLIAAQYADKFRSSSSAGVSGGLSLTNDEQQPFAQYRKLADELDAEDARDTLLERYG